MNSETKELISDIKVAIEVFESEENMCTSNRSICDPITKNENKIKSLNEDINKNEKLCKLAQRISKGRKKSDSDDEEADVTWEKEQWELEQSSSNDKEESEDEILDKMKVDANLTKQEYSLLQRKFGKDFNCGTFPEKQHVLKEPISVKKDFTKWLLCLIIDLLVIVSSIIGVIFMFYNSFITGIPISDGLIALATILTMGVFGEIVIFVKLIADGVAFHYDFYHYYKEMRKFNTANAAIIRYNNEYPQKFDNFIKSVGDAIIKHGIILNKKNAEMKHEIEMLECENEELEQKIPEQKVKQDTLFSKNDEILSNISTIPPKYLEREKGEFGYLGGFKLPLKNRGLNVLALDQMRQNNILVKLRDILEDGRAKTFSEAMKIYTDDNQHQERMYAIKESEERAARDRAEALRQQEESDRENRRILERNAREAADRDKEMMRQNQAIADRQLKQQEDLKKQQIAAMNAQANATIDAKIAQMNAQVSTARQKQSSAKSSEIQALSNEIQSLEWAIRDLKNSKK